MRTSRSEGGTGRRMRSLIRPLPIQSVEELVERRLQRLLAQPDCFHEILEDYHWRPAAPDRLHETMWQEHGRGSEQSDGQDKEIARRQAELADRLREACQQALRLRDAYLVALAARSQTTDEELQEIRRMQAANYRPPAVLDPNEALFPAAYRQKHLTERSVALDGHSSCIDGNQRLFPLHRQQLGSIVPEHAHSEAGVLMDVITLPVDPQALRESLHLEPDVSSARPMSTLDFEVPPGSPNLPPVLSPPPVYWETVGERGNIITDDVCTLEQAALVAARAARGPPSKAAIARRIGQMKCSRDTCWSRDRWPGRSQWPLPEFFREQLPADELPPVGLLAARRPAEVAELEMRHEARAREGSRWTEFLPWSGSLFRSPEIKLSLGKRMVVARLRPKLELALQRHGPQVTWRGAVLPMIDQLCCGLENLQQALDDPDTFLQQLVNALGLATAITEPVAIEHPKDSITSKYACVGAVSNTLSVERDAQQYVASLEYIRVGSHLQSFIRDWRCNAAMHMVATRSIAMSIDQVEEARQDAYARINSCDDTGSEEEEDTDSDEDNERFGYNESKHRLVKFQLSPTKFWQDGQWLSGRDWNSEPEQFLFGRFTTSDKRGSRGSLYSFPVRPCSDTNEIAKTITRVRDDQVVQLTTEEKAMVEAAEAKRRSYSRQWRCGMVAKVRLHDPQAIRQPRGRKRGSRRMSGKTKKGLAVGGPWVLGRLIADPDTLLQTTLCWIDVEDSSSSRQFAPFPGYRRLSERLDVTLLHPLEDEEETAILKGEVMNDWLRYLQQYPDRGCAVLEINGSLFQTDCKNKRRQVARALTPNIRADLSLLDEFAPRPLRLRSGCFAGCGLAGVVSLKLRLILVYQRLAMAKTAHPRVGITLASGGALMDDDVLQMIVVALAHRARARGLEPTFSEPRVQREFGHYKAPPYSHVWVKATQVQALYYRCATEGSCAMIPSWDELDPVFAEQLHISKRRFLRVNKFRKPPRFDDY